MEAMSFVRELRTAGNLEFVTLQFIIQKDNFRELRALIDLASTYCIDLLMITKIESHGSYAEQEFHSINVGDPANPLFNEYNAAVKDVKEYYGELQKERDQGISKEKHLPKIMWRLF